jgi:ribosome biogenesis GTPase
MHLVELGWDSFFDQHFKPFERKGYRPARVAREHKELYSVYTEHGELAAKVSGRMRHGAASRADFPAVGDWVAVEPRPEEARATIRALLPRKSSFSRKVAWARTEEQVVAANVDTVFLVCGLGNDFNPRRIERYLTVAWASGAKPVIVLNKCDLCPDVAQSIGEAETVAFGVPIFAASALSGQGLDELRAYIVPGSTSALLGSSGVGKSSLINRLTGSDDLPVGEVREHDGRGRHITTWRELIMVPGGGVVIDTPGMRELQLWAERESLEGSFEDIADLARACRFTDCGHKTEPGCAVKQAIEEGRLEDARLRSYGKLQRELAYLAVRKDLRARIYEKTRYKQIAKWSKARQKHGPKAP